MKNVLILVMMGLLTMISIPILEPAFAQDNPCPNGLVPKVDANGNPVLDSQGNVICIPQQ